MSRLLQLLAVFLLNALLLMGLPACAGPPSAGSDSAVTAAEPISLEGWASETIALPPGFAPRLPAGSEELRFAPRWRDPKTDNFWCYAFMMWIAEAAPNAARVDELLELYYDGLMAAVASGKGKELGDDPAQVEVVDVDEGRFEARLQFVDAFGSFDRIDLKVLIDVVAETAERTSLRVRVSPQSKEHPIWRALDAAIADILSGEGPER